MWIQTINRKKRDKGFNKTNLFKRILMFLSVTNYCEILITLNWKPITKVSVSLTHHLVAEIRLTIAISFVDPMWIRMLMEKWLLAGFFPYTISSMFPAGNNLLTQFHHMMVKKIKRFLGGWSDFCLILFLNYMRSHIHLLMKAVLIR